MQAIVAVKTGSAQLSRGEGKPIFAIHCQIADTMTLGVSCQLESLKHIKLFERTEEGIQKDTAL